MIKEKLQVDSVITSPPYYNLRDYGIEPSIWDGDPDCEHEFGEWKNEKNIRKYKIYDKECKSCKGKGIKKYNFWRGRQYWFEQQLEPYDKPLNRWGGNKYSTQTLEKSKYNDVSPNIDNMMRASHRMRSNSLGKNKRTVWEIPTQPNPGSHFAVFPPTLIGPMIKAGCPKFLCKKCGKPREKIFEKDIPYYIEKGIKYCKQCRKPSSKHKQTENNKHKSGQYAISFDREYIWCQTKFEKGYTDCGCNEGYEPGIVLDPFAGTSTTLYQAWKLGRNYIGFEISKEYCEIAENQLSKTRFKRLDAFIYSENGKIEV